METIKNIKKQSNNMIKKLLGLFMVFSLLFISVNAITQEQVIDYEFEQNGGSIFIDSSGFNNHLVKTEVTWTTEHVNGAFAVEFDGSGDYAQGIISYEQNREVSMSSWINVHSNAVDDIFTFFTNNEELLLKLQIDADEDGATLTVVYEDVYNVEQELIIDGNRFNVGEWYHVAFSYSYATQEITYYKGGNLVGVFPNINLREPVGPLILRLGVSEILSVNNFDGLLDSFKFFSFIFNSSQVSEIYNFDNITLLNDEVEDNITSIEYVLIDSFSPNNVTLTNEVTFELLLLQEASCDFYLNNQLTYTFEDMFSISFTEYLNEGEYEYFYYCSKLIGGVEFYELSEIYSFDVETPISQIIFQIEGNDFNVNDEELYIATPCPVEGYSAIGHVVGYQSKYNPDGINWRKLGDGIATFNLSAENHEFCLFNGRVITNDSEQTTNYNVQLKEGILNLGTFSIPTNNYQIYNLKVDLFEIYDVYNPKAHGSSWPAFISALIFFLLGGVIMYGGIKSESKVMVLIGGVLLLGAFGLSLGGVISLIQL